MKTIKIRIISNPFEKNIRYFKYDDKTNDYVSLEDSAKINSKSYTNAYISEKCNEIIFELYNRYNDNESNLEIDFVGNDKDYKLVENVIKNNKDYYNFIILLKNKNTYYQDGDLAYSKIVEKLKYVNLSSDDGMLNNIYEKCANQKNCLIKVLSSNNQELTAIDNQLESIKNKNDKRLKYFGDIVSRVRKEATDYTASLTIDVKDVVNQCLNDYMPKKQEISEEYNSIKENIRQNDKDFQESKNNREQNIKRQNSEIESGMNDLKDFNKNPMNVFTGIGKMVSNFAFNVRDNVTGFFDDMNEDKKNEAMYKEKMLIYLNENYSVGIVKILCEEKDKAFKNLVNAEKRIIESIDDINVSDEESNNNLLNNKIKSYVLSDDVNIFNIKNEFSIIDKVNPENTNEVLNILRDTIKKDLEKNSSLVNEKIASEIEVWVSGYITYIKNCFDEFAGDISNELDEYNKLLEQKSQIEELINRLENVKNDIDFIMSKQIK